MPDQQLDDRGAQPRRQRPTPSLKSRALGYLSRREYTLQELRRKLLSSLTPEQTEDDVDALLAALQARDFLSDARAAESLVRQKGARLGQARLRQELMHKGVDKALVDASLAPLQDSEFARAMQLWQAKFGMRRQWGKDFGDASAVDDEGEPEHLGREQAQAAYQAAAKEKAKQMRFLLSRGFSGELVRKVLEQAAQAEQED